MTALPEAASAPPPPCTESTQAGLDPGEETAAETFRAASPSLEDCAAALLLVPDAEEGGPEPAFDLDPDSHGLSLSFVEVAALLGLAVIDLAGGGGEEDWAAEAGAAGGGGRGGGVNEGSLRETRNARDWRHARLFVSKSSTESIRTNPSSFTALGFRFEGLGFGVEGAGFRA